MRNFIYKECAECGKRMELTPTRANRVCCSKECHYKRKPIKKSTIECIICNKPFKQKRSRDKLCSKECLYKHRGILGRTKRSKFEIMLFNCIQERFPSLKLIENDRITFQGLEIDIWIPELKLAIEWNGPFHYKPIYGSETLLSQQNRDIRKLKLANDAGIHLIVIPVIKTMTTKLFEPIKNDILKLIADIIKMADDGNAWQL